MSKPFTPDQLEDLLRASSGSPEFVAPPPHRRFARPPWTRQAPLAGADKARASLYEIRRNPATREQRVQDKLPSAA